MIEIATLRKYKKRENNMSKEKVILAYSGGLDTSVAITWLKLKDIFARNRRELEVLEAHNLQQTHL